MLCRVLGLTALALVLPLAGLAAQEGASETPPVVDVTAVDYAFVAPDTIPSGWVTFRMRNEGEELHVFDLLGLPEGNRYESFRRDRRQGDDEDVRRGLIHSADF